MITKETAREIFNAYQQLEQTDKLKEEIEGNIDRYEKDKDNHPIEKDGGFARYGKGLQLGIPNSTTGYSSMTLYDVSPEVSIIALKEHRNRMVHKLEELEKIAQLEMTIPLKDEL